MVKVEPNVLIWGSSLLHKYSNPSKHFQTVFLFARVLPLVRISATLDHPEGKKGQKPRKNGYFVDAESVRKTLDTIMFLHESVNRKALRIRNSFFWLNLIASLVRFLYKLDYTMKNHPK